MKHTFVAIALLFSTLHMTSARAELINLEEAIESMKAELLLNDHAKGFVLVHDCPQCPLKFAIDANTRAILDDNLIPLAAARSHMRRGVTVFFDPKTRVVTRLLLR